jgi:Tropinone reductase 1
VYKQTLDYTAEDFSFRVNTNLQSAFHLSQLAHPLLKASGAGRIVFVSSICSVVSVNIGYPIYLAAERYSILLQEFACLVKSCSKCCNLFMIKKKKKAAGGIHRLTRNLACELAKDNIRVNSVAPWFIRTPMTEDVIL